MPGGRFSRVLSFGKGKNKKNRPAVQTVADGAGGAVSTDGSAVHCEQLAGAGTVHSPTLPLTNQRSAPQQSSGKTCNNIDAAAGGSETNELSDDHQLADDEGILEPPENLKEQERIEIGTQTTTIEEQNDEVLQQDTNSSGYGSVVGSKEFIHLDEGSASQSTQSSVNDLSDGSGSSTRTLNQYEKQEAVAESSGLLNTVNTSQDSREERKEETGSQGHFETNIDTMEEEKLIVKDVKCLDEVKNGHQIPHNIDAVEVETLKLEDASTSTDREASKDQINHDYLEIELDGEIYRLRKSSSADSSDCSDMESDSESDGENSTDSESDVELPPDLTDKISSLCDESDVDYIHLTHKHHQVTLYGEGVSLIDECLKMYVKEKHHNLTINTCEQGRYSSLHEYAGKSARKFAGEIKVIQYIVEARTWKYHESATCGIILAGTQKNVSKPEQALYAVIPAHLPISTSHCVEICKKNPSMEMSDIEDHLRMTRTARYELQVHNRKIKIDLVDHPMAVYEEYFKKEGQNMEGSNRHKKFLKDMAIVKLDPGKLADVPGLLEEIRSAMSQKKLSSGHAPKPYKIGEVLPIKSPNDLIKLLRAEIDIKVGNFDGRSFFTGWPAGLKSNKRQRAFAFTFRTNKHQLVSGNSGLPVYAVDRTGDKLYPLGILNGEEKERPSCGTTVYSAALLAPNLQDIEERFGSLYAADLRSISTNGKGALNLDEIVENLRKTKKSKQRKAKSSARPGADNARKDQIDDDKICNQKEPERNDLADDSGVFVDTSMNSQN